MIRQSSEGDVLILNAFRSRFGSETGKVYAEFCEFLESIKLPFSLRNQMRQLDYPPTEGWKNGMPSTFYYFIPGSGWGSEIEFPEDPLNSNFVHSGDGMGLNLGCPIKLYFALNRLKKLDTPGDISKRLSEPMRHLAAVEELLWADVWKSKVSIRRAIPAEQKKWFDWICKCEETTLNIECKFRPSDWPRVVDGDAFQPLSLLGKASKQLPVDQEKALNVVAITGFAPVTPSLLSLIENELQEYPQIDAVAYAPLSGEISVHSLNHGTCARLLPYFMQRRADYFQPHYIVIHHRAQKEARDKARTKKVATGSPKVLESRGVPNL